MAIAPAVRARPQLAGAGLNDGSDPKPSPLKMTAASPATAPATRQNLCADGLVGRVQCVSRAVPISNGEMGQRGRLSWTGLVGSRWYLWWR